MRNNIKVEDSHNYQTPIPVCQYMASLIPQGAYEILEPTPGEGNIVGVLQSEGIYNVTAPEDFFQLSGGDMRYDCIVMNPPFSAKYAYGVPEDLQGSGMRLGYYILKRCMELSDNVIALMPWFTISDSDVRLRELMAYGLKSITALPRKTFNYIRVQTVVLELCKGYSGKTIFTTFENEWL